LIRLSAKLLYGVAAGFLGLCLCGLALLRRAIRKVVSGNRKPALVWAGMPIRGLADSSSAMQAAGFDSLSVAVARYPINSGDEFDIWLEPEDRLPAGLNTPVYLLRSVAVFASALLRRDVLHAYFNGGILARTPIASWEFRLWKLAGGRLCVMPYGSDAYVYAGLPDEEWANAIRELYPRTASEDRIVSDRIAAATQAADAVIGCIAHTVTLPRVDYWPLLWYPAPPETLAAQVNPPRTSGPIRLFHAPNHRRIKGTDALLDAIETLKQDGIDVELDLVEGRSHNETIERMAKADIVVDQLNFGYALTALEGMALGKPVISGIRDSEMYAPFFKLADLGEVPLIRATRETILAVLRDLIQDRQSWPALGKQGRTFVERHHMPANTVALFSGIYRDFGCKD
jgi:hypothetical protein